MWKARLTILGLLLVLAALVGLLVGVIAFRGWGAPRATIQNTPAVLKQIEGLSQLTTVKYVLEKVVILEDVKWYGENRVLLVAHGIVKAGVNFKRLTREDISIHGHRVDIVLPPPEILDCYLDDKRTQVVERSTGLLRFFDKDLEQDARRQAVDDIQRAARYNGILEDAEERAKEQITSLFRQMEMEVRFKK